MVMVAELRSLEFSHHVYEEVIHSLLTRQDEKDEAMQEALTVLQDMHRHVRIIHSLPPSLPPSLSPSLPPSLPPSPSEHNASEQSTYKHPFTT